jgi:MFS family permease
MARRLLLDVRPLRESPAFRRLFLGSTLSQVGTAMTTYAVALQVFTLTGSSAAVGGVGLSAAVPSICMGLFGGAIIDAVDRRKLVLLTSSGLTAVSIGFTVQAFAGLRQVWLLYALVAAQYLIASLNGPARRTFTPRLLPAHLLPAGIALSMLSMHVGLIAGPPLAGLITGAGGLRLCYLADAVTFLAALYGVARAPAMPPDGTRARPGLRAVGDGLRFIRGSRALLGALLSDLSATALAMPFALFPAINAERFGGSPRTLGLLTAAVATGGIIGTAFSGPVSQVSRPGRAMLGCVLGWGVSLIGFGLVRSFPLTFGCLVAAGVADVLSVVFRTTITQTATPDNYRGRVGAAEFVVGAAAPQLGNFRAGVLGSLTTPSTSATIGGLSSLVGAAVLTVTLPALIRYRAPHLTTPPALPTPPPSLGTPAEPAEPATPG